MFHWLSESVRGLGRFRYQKLADAQQAHIWTLRGIILLQCLYLGWLWHGWENAPRAITVHIPPDLRSGATQGIDEVPDYSVYAFAHYIFQQLNRWEQDGSVDFARRIAMLSPYLTPRYREDLLAKYAERGQDGQLQHRVRGVQLVPGHGYEEARVRVLNPTTWTVLLDLELIETAHGMVVKNPVIRYPLRVVRWQVDPEQNPWGLALDGYAEKPYRIDIKDLAATF
jgi:integrating conjugative element protein (TIGR03746 family)